MEQLAVSSVQLSLKRRPDRLLIAFNVIGSRRNAPLLNLARLHATIHTQTIHGPHSRKPAPRGATHDKLTSKEPPLQLIVRIGTHFSLCLSPPSNGSMFRKSAVSSASSQQMQVCRNRAFASARLVCAAGRRTVGGGLIELAIKRGAADFKSPRDLRHLAAIMRNREPDDLGLHLFQRPHLA